YKAPKNEQLKGHWIGAIDRSDSRMPQGRKMHTATFSKSKRDSIIASADSLAWRSIMLRKEFKTEKELRSAKIYISALGHYKLNINKQSIGQSESVRMWSAYDKSVYYHIYDVTPALQEGEN